MQAMRVQGFDGVDWDIEVGLDTSAWNPGMHLLRDSLNAVGTQLGRPLTNSVWTYGGSPYLTYKNTIRDFNRIHIEGYEQTGPSQGWIVWNGYGIYTGGYHLPCYSYLSVAGVDSVWAGWERAGASDTTLLFSQSCSGRLWTGGTIVSNIRGFAVTGTDGALHPGDVWIGSDPAYGQCGSYAGMPAGSQYETPYTDIATGSWASYPVMHDTVVLAAWKSQDNPGNASDQFISFPDPWTWWQDWHYMAHVRNGGGMSMWDAWRGRISVNNFPLIDALKLSIADTPLPPEPSGTFTVDPDTLPAGGGQVTLTWTSSDATSASISPAIGSVALSGSISLNVSASMTFTLSLTNTTAEVQYTGHVGVPSSGGGVGDEVTDDFNRANATTLGSGWAIPSGRGSCGIYNNQCNGANGQGFNYRTETFGNDQFAEISPKSSLAGYRYESVGIRMGGANGEGYYAKTDGVQTLLVKMNSSGTATTLQTLNVGYTEYGQDRLRIQAIGNIIKVFKNNIQISLDQVDGTITSGHPGVWITPDNNTALDDFYAGDFTISGQPTIHVSIPSLTFTSIVPNPSTAQIYQVSGVNLTANIIVTAPTDFQVSLNGTSWGSSVTLTQSGGVVNSTNVQARFNRSTAGSSSGNITHASSGATTQSVAVSGVAVVKTMGISGSSVLTFRMIAPDTSVSQYYILSFTGFGYVGASTINITRSGANPTDFQVSLNNSTWGASANYTPLTNTGSIPIYVRCIRGTIGTSTASILNACAGLTTQTVSVSGISTLDCGPFQLLMQRAGR
jgi:hypothetical protein